MTEAQKQFEAWFDEYSDKNDIRLAINYGAYEIAGDAWQHQQQRIEESESKLKIAIYAMKKYHEEMQHQGFEGGECLLEALKQIEVK